MTEYLVVVSGASGAAYGLRLVEQLLLAGGGVTFVATPSGRDIVALETGLALPVSGGAEALLRFLELPPHLPLRAADPEDMSDPWAAGSKVPDAMVVCPASTGLVAAVAAGSTADLAERAAEVMLQHRRPLVLVPNETPLSLIHLRNLTAAAEAGAVIVPAMPAFRQRPTGLDDIVNHVVGEVLDALGVDHDMYPGRRG